MKISKKVREQIENQLTSGEQLRALELGQIKDNMGKEAAKTVALSLTRAIVTGGGRTRGAFALIWVAVTRTHPEIILVVQTEDFVSENYEARGEVAVATSTRGE